MDSRPIGVFDSGFGGLTAVRVLRKLLPAEDIVFFADNGRAPYGGRPTDELRRMARQDLELVASYDTKAIIAACGTVSSNAADVLRNFRVPTIGVLDAAAETLGAETDGGAIGVIATEASIRSGAFDAALRRSCPGREIVSIACPAFVPLIESGRCDETDGELREAVALYLRPLKERGVSTLLLGCTHYGLIEAALRAYLGDGVRLVEASRCAAEKLRDYVTEHNMTGGCGQLRCLTSGEGARFRRLAPLFLREDEAPPTETLPPMEI